MIEVLKILHIMNYLKKPGFNLHQSRHCAYIVYIIQRENLVIKILSVADITLLATKMILHYFGNIMFFPNITLIFVPSCLKHYFT